VEALRHAFLRKRSIFGHFRHFPGFGPKKGPFLAILALFAFLASKPFKSTFWPFSTLFQLTYGSTWVDLGLVAGLRGV
jgi:hypothetical protein